MHRVRAHACWNNTSNGKWELGLLPALVNPTATNRVQASPNHCIPMPEHQMIDPPAHTLSTRYFRYAHMQVVTGWHACGKQFPVYSTGIYSNYSKWELGLLPALENPTDTNRVQASPNHLHTSTRTSLQQYSNSPATLQQLLERKKSLKIARIVKIPINTHT